MATDVVMPQMGESIAEGTITKWLVKVGEKVERDQPLFEISTDKVDAEIPSPVAGTLVEILNQAGETVPVNQVVARIGEAGAASAAAPAPAPAKPAEKPAEKPAPTESPKPSAPSPAPAPAAAPAQPAPSAARPAPAAGSVEERVRTVSSPLVRNIAREHGVELSQVEGTGVHGRVTKQDILAYLEQPAARAAAPPRAAAAAADEDGDRLPRPGVPAGRERGDRADVEDPPDHRRAHALLEGHLGARDHGLPHGLHQGAQRARTRRSASSPRRTAPSSPTCRSSSRRSATASRRIRS